MMKSAYVRLPLLMTVGAVLMALSAGCADPGRTGVIFSPADASPSERLAAKEVRRYIYLRTGMLLPIRTAAPPCIPVAGAVIIARKDRPLATSVGDGNTALAALASESYLLRSIPAGKGHALLIAGADDTGTLYGAYRFAERLGVRFYLHGDTVPDGRVPLELGGIDESGSPLFELRGIQPFHDFPEGPDWWTADDYKAILAQLAKLRMNFLGLHTYPEGRPNAEPTVWIGPEHEIGEGSGVKASYASSYQNTLRGNWGYAPRKTSLYINGASLLFDRDDYGVDIMRGMCPQPAEPEAQNELFRRTGTLLGEAFRYAHALGIKTCVGTETPLVVPKAVAERLKAGGRDSADIAVIQKLYEGVFRRIMQAYPLDFYWFWTPEGWTWEGTTETQVNATLADIKAAAAAAEAVKAPFQLATCGWVLGPQSDRSLFDRVLPKSMAVSCINRQVGMTPVETGFANVSGRGKWAIPWMEDDPALTSPQLWAGRMRKDAADALAYGCNGLMGIHWRTRVLAMNVSALAQAAWSQEGWKQDAAPTSGPLGGQVAAYPNNPIEGTENDPLYQTVRFDVSGYRLYVPNGTYSVKLQFSEPHYSAAGKRVFDVKLQGKPVIETLDIFAKVGQNKALDYSFESVAVTNGRIDIDFGHRTEFPSIAGIVAQSPGTTIKINCGGPAYKDYIADPAGPGRDMPTADFYRDWTLQNFGPEAAAQIAAIFTRMDGKLPRPSDWVDGPGGIRPDTRPWEQVQNEYAFVGELEALLPLVTGAGARERFTYWVETFRYMRAIAEVKCIRGLYDGAAAKVKAEKNAKARAELAHTMLLPLRARMIQAVAEVYRHMFATVTTPGELGTVMNWEQHILPDLLDKPGVELAGFIGSPVPETLQPSHTYTGRPRIIVPTVRTHLSASEALALPVILLAREAPQEAAMYWRTMGTGGFHKIALTHVARGVYSVTLPQAAHRGDDFEYYVQAEWADGTKCAFPATATQINQTVVVTEGS